MSYYRRPEATESGLISGHNSFNIKQRLANSNAYKGPAVYIGLNWLDGDCSKQVSLRLVQRGQPQLCSSLLLSDRNGGLVLPDFLSRETGNLIFKGNSSNF